MKKLKFHVTNYEVSIYPLYMLGEVLARDFKKVFGRNYMKLAIGEWNNRTNRWATDSETSDRVARFTIKKILRNRQFITKAIKNIYFYCSKLIKFSEKFIKEDLKKKSDKELYKYYQEYNKRFKQMYVWAWVPNAPEGESDILSNKLENYLLAKLKKIGKEHLLGAYFSVLITLIKNTIRQKEEEDLLRVFWEVKNKRIDKSKVDKLLEAHAKKYCWIPFNYEGETWDKNYFLKKLDYLIKQNKDPQEQLEKIEKAKKDLRRKQVEFVKELGIDKDKNYLYLFEITRQLSYIKDYRKNILYKSYYHLDKLIREIAKRLNLTSTQVRHIVSSEMNEALLDRIYDPEELKRRISYSAAVISKKGTSIFSGKEAEEIVKKLAEEEKEGLEKAKEIIGQSACGGRVRGLVKIIQETRDMAKMKNGDILVSEKTDPSLLLAIKKAVAIVTNTGGITCHAAIISRELNIPCIIGTKIATKVLKDGDLVEVDAERGTVKIIKKA